MIHLVTGGLGFIGSHLVKALHARGRKVRVLDNFRTGSTSSLDSSKYDLCIGDICMERDVRNAMDGVSHVYHLAAEVSVVESFSEPKKTVEVNINGTLNVIRAAIEHKVERFVFASSTAASSPVNFYGLTKSTGEKMLRLYQEQLPFTALRFFNVFGPAQSVAGGYSAVIPAFINALLRGEQPKIYGDGKQKRDFVYVNTVVRALMNAALFKDAIGKVVDVGSGESRSVLELLAEVSRVVGVDANPRFLPARPGDVSNSVAQTREMEWCVGVTATDDRFTESLSQTVDYYRGKR